MDFCLSPLVEPLTQGWNRGALFWPPLDSLSTAGDYCMDRFMDWLQSCNEGTIICCLPTSFAGGQRSLLNWPFVPQLRCAFWAIVNELTMSVRVFLLFWKEQECQYQMSCPLWGYVWEQKSLKLSPPCLLFSWPLKTNRRYSYPNLAEQAFDW